ncbi:MAG: hypothetical protein FJ279_27820, partial [Planctomycetes bacterium]|nr:hypothetical protein [Planctomycetota bacterium]
MLLRAALVVCGQEPGRVLSLDAGGYSANVPETARAHATMGENLLKNAGFEKLDAKTREAEEWTWSFHVYSGVHDEQRKRELEQVLRALARREITAVGAGSGGRCAFVAHPVKMDEMRGKPALNFTSYYRQRVVLPELTGDTKFVFAVSTRGRAEAGVRESRARVSFECFDRPTYQRDQKVLKFFQEYLALGSEWQRNEAPFLAPKDTRSVQVSLHLDNCGEAWFDDAALHRTALDQGVVMRLMPGYFMDNLFCLSAGDPGILLFSFRNEREAKIVKPLAVVELPEGVDVLAIRDGLPIAEKVTVQHAIRYALDIKNLARAIQKESYSVQNGLSLVVRTTLPVSDRTLTGRYWFADGEYRTEPLEFSLKVLPAIRGQRPVGFETAAMFTNEVTSISDEKAVAALADFYERVGLNAVHTSPCALGQALGEKKITRYYQPYWLCNGYRLGAGKKPDSAAFRFADGTLSDDGICPTEVYARGPYFQEGVVNAILRKAIVADRSTEHIMPNWEPFMYKYKGCFCDRCRDEFVKHSKVPGEEVAKSWPKHIIRDHRDVWMRFRSWQHGRLVQTLE